MKAKEFVEKYDLDNKKWNPKYQSSFLNDLTSELIGWCEVYKAKDNIKGFENALRVIRQKWDGISKRVLLGLPDGLWNYFFATVVAPMRENLCPKEVARRKAEAEERKQAYERRNAWRKELDDMMYDSFRQNFYERMALAYLILSSVPTESFQFMELPTSATPDEIRSKYRELAHKYHPDHGGDTAKMVELNEAKNKCLKWAERNQ